MLQQACCIEHNKFVLIHCENNEHCFLPVSTDSSHARAALAESVVAALVGVTGVDVGVDTGIVGAGVVVVVSSSLDSSSISMTSSRGVSLLSSSISRGNRLLAMAIALLPAR